MSHTITIAGRLGRDPEMQYTQDGTPVTHFSVASDVGWGERKRTMWVRVTCWGKLAEAMNEHLAKGALVQVSGQLQPEEYGGPNVWADRDGNPRGTYDMRANDIAILVWPQREEDKRGPAEPQSSAAPFKLGAPPPRR